MAKNFDNKKINKIDNLEEPDDFFEIPNVVSSTELTGLMYKPPENAGELEAYNDLFSMPMPKYKHGAKK